LQLTFGFSPQPFAWPAREFVRQKVIGKPITFELEETATTISKSFGSVYVNGENLAYAIVAAGWAKVKPPMGNSVSRTADHEELSRLEAEVSPLLPNPTRVAW
jgi:staphylococcal nuclease domain-containing protein 1